MDDTADPGAEKEAGRGDGVTVRGPCPEGGAGGRGRRLVVKCLPDSCDRGKALHTFVLYLIMLGMGSMHTVVGPTLLDLAVKRDAHISRISLVFIFQGVGFAIGTVAGGLLIERVPKKIFLVAVTAVTAAVTASIPWWPSVALLCLCFFLRGTTIRALEIGCNIALLDLWGVESSMPMQGLHLFLAIGCALGPMLVKPFLGQERDPGLPISATGTTTGPDMLVPHTSIATTNSSLNTTGSLQAVNLENSQIELAYIIVGVYLFVIAGLALLCYQIWPPESKSNNVLKQELEKSPMTAEDSRRERVFIVKFITLGTLMLFLYFGAILSFDSYLNTFCVESKLHMTQQAGATLGTSFWSAFILARLLACFYAGRVSDLKIITVDLVSAQHFRMTG